MHLSLDEEQYCKKYDPTEQNWYKSGSVGSKNVVVLLDSSINMKNTGYHERSL